ncbi:MAG: TonB-dependent receptor, partial [Flavobacteriaceae bacterium]|nr:TonB-dependent receptor [Flavobacteriaceae bacterium]
TNRAGKPGEDVLFGVSANNPTWGDWLSDNPDLGMTVGQPDMQKGEFFINAGIPFKNGNGEFYGFAGLTFRKGKSFALFRAPYWVPDPHNLLHDSGSEYNGFQPTFETDIFDSMDGLGVKFGLGEFKVDISGTFGINTVDYTIGNTLNPDLGAASPTNFNAGAYKFQNLIGNIDVSRNFGNIGLAFGVEARTEQFTVEAGELDSYSGGGAQSFPGLQPSNALKEDRSSLGAYGDVEWDITEAFLLGGAIRYENFSDFGSNTSWKLNGRYKLGDNGAIRASISTGFRAPALHQIYLSNIQTLVSGGTVSNQGTFNNVDPVIVDGLGVPALKAETSNNISAGITYKFTRNFYISLDYYNIKVDDRVLFTGEIGYQNGGPGDPNNNPVEEILDQYDVTSLKFFTNAVDTKTNGIDIVASYNNIELGSGILGATLAFNWNETEIVGNITTPPILEQNGYEIFNRKEASRIESSRPKTKATLGINYDLNKFHASLNNTYFGEVTWKHSNNGLNGGDFGNGPIPINDEDFDQTFGGKIITDLIVRYDISEKFAISATVNNLFNVYPDVIDTKGDFVTDLGGRFKYPWEVNQFGFSGTIIKAGITFRF